MVATFVDTNGLNLLFPVVLFFQLTKFFYRSHDTLDYFRFAYIHTYRLNNILLNAYRLNSARYKM